MGSVGLASNSGLQAQLLGRALIVATSDVVW